MLRVVAMSAALLALVACSAILGLDDYGPASGGGGQGGAAGAGGAGQGGGWLETHSHRYRLVLDTTIVNEDLEGFATPIVITADTGLASTAQPDGRDIAFTADDGTRLSHEIEHYDGVTGALVAWVRLGTIQAASTTALYLYFGDADAADQQDLAGTWPATRYRGVWHLSNNPGDAPPQMLDSSTHGSDGEAVASPSSVTGAAARALAFDGATSRVVIPDADHLDLDPAGFSYSCWVKAQDSTASAGRALQKTDGSQSRGYVLNLGEGPWYAQLFDGVATLNLHLGGEASYIDTWTHIALVVDPMTGFIVAYTNGAVNASEAIDAFDLAALPNNEPLYFSAGGGPFLGAIDEVRLYGVALTSDWVALEHRALASPGYLTVDAVELAP